ncbi:MAG TPA: hypothetical protein DEA32_01865 [Firmicutes bacterium]|nr:hypothetical protein [Bacillota bacterium]
MNKALHLVIITPESKEQRMDASQVICQTNAGYIDLLSDHESLIANIEISPLIIVKDDKRETYIAGGGALRMDNATNTATLILRSLEPDDKITEIEALEEKRNAEEKLRAASSTEEHRRAQRELEHAISAIAIASKKSR